jgi:hypothetical protein
MLGRGGIVALKKLWDDLDLSLALSRAGIMKRSGISTWLLVFTLIVSWFSKQSSVLQAAKLTTADDVLKSIVGKVSQSALSRFLTTPFQWSRFNRERVIALQDHEDCRLQKSDVLIVDDSFILHEHAEKIPFVYRLKDHVSKRYVQTQKVVALYAARRKGPSYAIDAEFWQAGEGKPNKWQMALRMLTDLVSYAPHVKGCTVAVDSWYFVRNFFLSIEELGLRFVTKVKSNTVFYELKPGKRFTDRGAYKRVTAKELQRQLLGDASIKEQKLRSKQVFIKIKDETTGHFIYKKVTVVAVSRHKSHKQSGQIRPFVLVTGDLSANAEEILKDYESRWEIETYFRESKQDLSFESCHSTSEEHAIAWLAIQLCAHTLLAILTNVHNNNIAPEEALTHGQVIREFLGAYTEIVYLENDEILLQYTPSAKALEMTLTILMPANLPIRWFQVMPRSA